MTKRLSVLALDLATVTGWAAWGQGFNSSLPACDAVRLKGRSGEVGMSTEHLRLVLNELHRRFAFTHIFFEAQHIPMPKKHKPDGEVQSRPINIETIYKLISLGGMVEWWGYKAGVEVFKVEIGSWRKHFLGRGTGFKKAGMDPKDEAIRRCEAIGVLTTNHNTAEAVGILDYSLTLFDNLVPPWRDKAIFERI
jgi:hypothetical protein